MENKDNIQKKEEADKTLEKNKEKKNSKIYTFMLILFIAIIISAVFLITMACKLASTNLIPINAIILIIVVILFFLILGWAALYKSKLAKVILNIFCICLILGFIYFLATIIQCYIELSKCPG